jgi:hypothetical protein
MLLQPVLNQQVIIIFPNDNKGKDKCTQSIKFQIETQRKRKTYVELIREDIN